MRTARLRANVRQAGRRERGNVIPDGNAVHGHGSIERARPPDSLGFSARLVRSRLASFLLLHSSMNEDQRRASGERSMLIPEAAEVLGVSRRTVYYRIREGRLRTIRTRGGSQRVLWSSIEALLRSTVRLPAVEQKPCGDSAAP